MGIEEYRSRFTQGLALEHAYHWERTRPHAPWLPQPAGGRVVTLDRRAGVAQARRMAAYLQTLGLPHGSAIGLLAKSSAHWILADLAIWMAGHVTVPMYSTSSADMVRQIIEHSEAKLLFVGKLDAWDAVARGVPADLPRIALPLAPAIGAPTWDDLVARTEPIAGEPVRGPDELATIVYTSGTTGQPKGVMHTHGAIAKAFIGIAEVHTSIGPGDRLLCHLPLAHVAERVATGVGSMFGGTHVFFTDTLDTFPADLKRARPTLFMTVPRLWQKFQLAVSERISPRRLALILRLPVVSGFVRKKLLQAMGLDAVRLAAAGAAPVPPALIEWYVQLGIHILDSYGMSENFGYSHGTRPDRIRPGYCGEAMPRVECRIGSDGEVLVKSPAALSGYFKDPALTAASFTEDGFFRTGDRGDIDGLGRLRITGRVKELFKTSKGKYIAPVPLEHQLASHPSIEAVCVAGIGRPQPHALVMLGADATRKTPRAELATSLATQLAALNASVDPHERLQFVAVVRDPWLPDNGLLTPTMKIKRAEIEKKYEPLLDGWYADGRTVLWE